jgi:7-cyano-7-deazaguanine synthase
MIPKSIVHLLSGGLDSVTMLYDLHGQGHLVHCLLVDYRQRHVQELEFAKLQCRRLGVLFTRIELPSLGGLNDTDWVVPNRNAILISIAVNTAIQMNAGTVTIGCNADDAEMFQDCRQEFLSSMNASVRSAGYDIEVCAPYIDWPKWRIGGHAKSIGVPINEVWTCYLGGEKPCGLCPACEKFKLAMK